MKETIFQYVLIVTYYIVSFLLCYNFISDSILFCIVFPIWLPLAILLGIGCVIFFLIGLIAGLQYLNKLFLSSSIYLTAKPVFALIFFFLIYSAFALITDSIFFERSSVICPIDTHYYHWDMECYYLPNDYYPMEEEECTIFTAFLKGRKACNECVNYISDVESRRNSLISFSIIYLLFCLFEYLYKEELIPTFILKLFEKVRLKSKDK